MLVLGTVVTVAVEFVMEKLLKGGWALVTRPFRRKRPRHGPHKRH